MANIVAAVRQAVVMAGQLREAEKLTAVTLAVCKPAIRPAALFCSKVPGSQNQGEAMHSQTEYETTRRTTVKRSTRPTPAVKKIAPWPDPEALGLETLELGHPGSCKGMISFRHCEGGWVLFDGCVPESVARMVKAAYEAMTV